jgi:hypothetical protein
MTDKLNFPDLTKITAPLGLLDDDTYARLCAWSHGLEYWDGGEWVGTTTKAPRRGGCWVYRARPAPLVPDSVDWSHVAEPYDWHARDESGSRSFYTRKPDLTATYWRLEGRQWEAADSAAVASYRRGTVDWRDSLISRPGAEK